MSWESGRGTLRERNVVEIPAVIYTCLKVMDINSIPWNTWCWPKFGERIKEEKLMPETESSTF